MAGRGEAAVPAAAVVAPVEVVDLVAEVDPAAPAGEFQLCSTSLL